MNVQLHTHTLSWVKLSSRIDAPFLHSAFLFSLFEKNHSILLSVGPLSTIIVLLNPQGRCSVMLPTDILVNWDAFFAAR